MKSKKILVIVGIFLLIVNLILHCIDYGSDGILLLFMDIIRVGSINWCLLISSILLITVGVLENDDKSLKEKKNIKNKNMKCKILVGVGFLPFIGILAHSVFLSITGMSWFFNTIYGFEAFILNILTMSLFLWPLYLIGIVMIIKGLSGMTEK